jgi:flavodoxin I
MSRIGIFFGTDTGRTRRVAKDLARKLGDLAAAPVNINKAAPEDLLAYDALILGTPTLGEGAVPGLDTGGSMESWLEFLPKAAGLDLAGKVVALFGLGDQDKYGEHFVSALRPLHDWARARGATLVGHWPTAGYDYVDSEAVEGDHFLGLAIDQHNQAELTEARLTEWLAQVMPALLAAGAVAAC